MDVFLKNYGGRVVGDNTDHGMTGQLINTPRQCNSSSNRSKAEIGKETLIVWVYPNPTSDFLNIDWQDGQCDGCTFELFDATGRKHRSLSLADDTQTTRIDLSDLPKGSYYYSIFDENQIIKSDVVLILK